MSDRNTDEQIGFGPSPSVSLPNDGLFATTGLGLTGGLPGRTAVMQLGSVQDLQPSKAQPSDSGPIAIEFRVTREGSPSRRLRLSGQRYTFGSGEGCSIRLADPTLRPMHAVLIRDAHRILVHAYSVPIQVNGDRTTEATLYVGDLLQLGSYRLELLGADSDLRTPHEPAGGWGGETPKLRFADAPTLTSSRGGSSKSFRAAAQRADSLAAEESAWREQLRREVEQWRMAKAECDRRESRCDDRETDMRERESQLWTRAERLRRREAELKAQETAVLEIQKEYEAKKLSLAKLRAEDRARQEDFESREAEFRQLEQDYREQIERATNQLQRSQEQASVANHAVQRMRDQFATLNGQLAELTAKQSELHQHERTETEQIRLAHAELERARDEALAQRDEAVSQRDEFATQRDEAALQLDEVAAQRDEAALQRDEVAAQLDVMEAEFDEAASQRDRVAAQRDKIASQFDTAAAQRDDATAQRDDATAQRDEATAQRDEVTAQRDEAILKLNESASLCEQASRNRDESISQRDIALRERDGAIDAQAKSDAQRIELSEELSRAAQRLAEFENELAESRRIAQDSERSTDELHDQVRQLQESVASAKRETQLLRSDYEDACQSITRLEGLLNDQSRHGDEVKESWELEAEHLRQAFEGVSRDLAVALGELSELRDENTAFSSQLESMRTEKAKVESELQARPTNDAWEALQGELMLASESLQIIQRDYNATLTELENLRCELDEEREIAADRERHEVSTAGILPKSDEPSLEATPSSEAQWSDEDDAWPTYNAASAVSIAAAKPDASEPDLNEQADAIEEIAPSAERIALTDSAADLESDEQVESSVDHAHFDELEANDENEIANEQSHDVESSYWATPQDLPVVAPESGIQDVDIESSDWGRYPADVDDQQDMGDELAASRDVEYAASSTDDHDKDNGEDSVDSYVSYDQPDKSITSEDYVSLDNQSDESEFGSLAHRLIADLDRQESTAQHQDNEDDERESYFEATALSANNCPDADAQDQAGWERNDDESPLPWRVEPESVEPEGIEPGNGDLDWEPTMLHGVEPHAHQPIDELEEDEALPDSTSPWSHQSYDEQPAAKDSFNNPNEIVDEGDDASDQEDDLKSSHVWTSASDSAVMDSELVASDDDHDRNSGSRTEVVEATVVGGIQPSASKEEFEDDSIEAYMNRLLQRVQGAPAGEPTKSPEAAALKTPTTILQPVPRRETKSATALSEVGADSDSNAQMMPRSPASEKHGNLSAMRQLANETARTAINRSVKTQTRDTQLKAFTKFGTAAGLVFCAIAVFLFTHFTGKMIISGCMCVVAFVWVNEGFKLLGDARRRLELAAAGKLEEEDSDKSNEESPSVS